MSQNKNPRLTDSYLRAMAWTRTEEQLAVAHRIEALEKWRPRKEDPQAVASRLAANKRLIAEMCLEVG